MWSVRQYNVKLSCRDISETKNIHSKNRDGEILIKEQGK